MNIRKGNKSLWVLVTKCRYFYQMRKKFDHNILNIHKGYANLMVTFFMYGAYLETKPLLFTLMQNDYHILSNVNVNVKIKVLVVDAFSEHVARLQSSQ